MDVFFARRLAIFFPLLGFITWISNGSILPLDPVCRDPELPASDHPDPRRPRSSVAIDPDARAVIVCVWYRPAPFGALVVGADAPTE